MLFFTFLFFLLHQNRTEPWPQNHIKYIRTLSFVYSCTLSTGVWLKFPHHTPTRHLCMHSQCCAPSWNQTQNHTDCWRGISASASLLMIYRGCGREIYFKAPVCVHTYTCNHIVYMICATHAWQLDIYAKAIDTLTKCFSHFLFSCAKERSEDEMHDWVREMEWIGGRKSLKPFLLFVAEPRFFFPIPWYCLFFRVQSLATKSHISQLPLTEYVFIRNWPLSLKTLVLACLRRKWAVREITLLSGHMAAQTALHIYVKYS